MVATARRGVGDMQGAISLLQWFEREPILVHVQGFAGFDWLRCMTLLAEFYQEQGRTTEAARVAGKVRAMLKHADADHPFRARLERLPSVLRSSFDVPPASTEVDSHPQSNRNATGNSRFPVPRVRPERGRRRGRAARFRLWWAPLSQETTGRPVGAVVRRRGTRRA